MNVPLAKRIVLVWLISLTVIGCSTTERLNKAATAQGIIQASVMLPEYPADCRVQEPHAAIEVGSELRAVLVRERNQLDRQNARGGRCAQFWDNVKTKFSGQK